MPNIPLEKTKIQLSDALVAWGGLVYTPVRGRNSNKRRYRRTRDAPRGGHAGGEAALVLIREHLTDIDWPEPSLVPAMCAGEMRPGWFRPSEGVNHGCNEFGENYVVKKQVFSAGGAEFTVRSTDLEKIGRAMEVVRKRGKREAPLERTQESINASARRARKNVRLKTKNMGATHLVTFNVKEGPGVFRWTPSDWDDWRNGGKEAWESEHGAFLTEQDWAVFWDRLRRMIIKAKGEFDYVAVLEKHAKGNLHLHVAWSEPKGQKVNIGFLRKCWHLVLGAGRTGNVDAKFIKTRAGLERAARVANYISKYIGKRFEEDCRFNKKRYWASKNQLLPVERVIINATNLNSAFEYIANAYGISLSDYMVNGKYGLSFEDFFEFPEKNGFWLAFIPGKHSVEPPF